MEQIHFSDNFFFLRNRIQILLELLELEINASIFNQRIMDEVRSISEQLSEQERLLNERNQIQEFTKLSHQLFRIKHAFLEFLRGGIQSQKGFMQVLIKRNGEEWSQIVDSISEGNEKLAQEFRFYSQNSENKDQMVSDAEMEMLFHSEQVLES